MFGKKGVESQFNWVFVLVAGGIILLLFGAVIIKQKQLSDISISRDALNKIQAVLSSARTTTQSQQVSINAPIRSDCNSLQIGATSSTLNDFVFAPSVLKGTKLTVFTKEWNVPFRVSNFIYLTTEQTTYYITYQDDPLHKELAQSIQKVLQASSLDVRFHNPLQQLDTSILNDNDNLVVILVGSTSNYASALQNIKTVKVIRIEPDATTPENGTVTFLSEVPVATEEYLTLPAILGAVFSPSRAGYKCVMDKAYIKLNSLATLYGTRLSGVTCGADAGFYSNAITELGVLAAPNQKNDYFTAAQDLMSENVKAALAACPLVY